MAEYVPGTCNIGHAEIQRRRQVAWAGAVAAVALAAALWAAQAAPTWRLLLFLPVSVAVGSGLQVRYQFCANYGMRGVYNVAPGLIRPVRVEDPGARAADRRKAIAIAGGGLAAGVLVALVAYALP